jgi:hypothetical protein
MADLNWPAAFHRENVHAGEVAGLNEFVGLVDARIVRTLEDRKWLKKNLRACMNCLMLSKRL